MSMRIVTTHDELRAARAELSGPVGVVPTMGYLHAGHATLIDRACAECESVIVTLFVNPTQFGPHEDFERYPRDFDRDREICHDHGADLLYAPSVEQVYQPGFVTRIEVGDLADRWEGASRPGHFTGVATVVTKLLNSTSADRAYFGEKDFQQLQVIRRLVLDLDIPTEIVGCPTIRELDGLAMSSRNAYLTADERPRAATIHQGLSDAQSALASGTTSATDLCGVISSEIERGGLIVDYVAIVDPMSLRPIQKVDKEARALVAARLGRIRLIDNVRLNPPS